MNEGFAGSSKGARGYGATSERFPSVGFSSNQANSTEMNNLVENVTSNIYAINNGSKKLQQALKMIGTQMDNKKYREDIHTCQQETNKKISVTTQELQKLTAMVKRGDKSQKLQLEMLANSFQEAMKMYAKYQKEAMDKMRTCTLPSEVAISDDTEASDRDSELIFASKQKALTRELEFEKGLLAEREQMIKNIETNVINVRQIMEDLGTIVVQQSEDINTIESNIENVHESVESANKELSKASAYVDKRRKRTCILLGVSVAVGIVLTVILAVSLH